MIMRVSDMCNGDVLVDEFTAETDTKIYVLKIINYKETGETRVERLIIEGGVTRKYSPLVEGDINPLDVGISLSLAGWSSHHIWLFTLN